MKSFQDFAFPLKIGHTWFCSICTGVSCRRSSLQLFWTVSISLLLVTILGAMFLTSVLTAHITIVRGTLSVQHARNTVRAQCGTYASHFVAGTYVEGISLAICNRHLLIYIYWINNVIRAVFFSKFERLFQKNMYNSIIQTIAHLKLWLFPIFLAICEFHPKRTAPAWPPRMDQANFWYSVLMWTVFMWGHSASIGTNGSQNGQGLGYKAGGVKLPIHCFPIVLNRDSNMGPSVVMMENYCLLLSSKVGSYHLSTAFSQS